MYRVWAARETAQAFRTARRFSGDAMSPARNVKLTPKLAQALRLMLDDGVPMRRIADALGIGVSRVHQIAHGDGWNDVPCPTCGQLPREAR